jgi:tRNA(Ile)-lysidine synthase
VLAEPNTPNWSSLHVKLQKTLCQLELLPKRVNVLMAISGGQDSLCLGQLLIDLQTKWHWQLAVAHCDHGWPEDTGIADRVRQVAAQWQIPYHCWNTQGLAETEATARDWRYQALSHIAMTRGYQYVVTAHTQSDVAETLLYNLMRGAGSDGLSSLPASRPLTDRLTLVRPLLQIQRTETADFCRQRHLPVWSDAYNYKMKYARNRVRQNLLPLMESQFNPQASKHLAQTAEILQAETAYLEAVANNYYQQASIPTEPGIIDRTILQPLPLAIQRRVIRLFLSSQRIALNFAAIEQVVKLIHAPRGSQTSSLAGGLVQVQGNHLKIKKGHS